MDALGQARRLAWFLAAVYNGALFPFDLTQLRGTRYRARACLDYLNYDRLGRREVHRWIADYGIGRHGIPE